MWKGKQITAQISRLQYLYMIEKFYYFILSNQLIPPGQIPKKKLGDLPEIEESLYLTTTMDGVQFIPKILLPLSIIKVSMVIKSLNMQTIKPENKNCFLGTKHSHNDVCKVSLLKNLFFGHMGFDFIC